jgi:5-formaminoimidazole-4-carboxamide-1-beta-D-ribofuranosyl 5'-monophosphate synthetase
MKSDLQDLVFIRESIQEHVFEVQTIAIESVSDDLFRFGLYGVFTGKHIINRTLILFIVRSNVTQNISNSNKLKTSTAIACFFR